MPRTRHGWRPRGIESLEGRTLLATSAFDPTFGVDGVVVGISAIYTTQTSNTNAVAVQGDGKIVTAETSALVGTGTSPTSTPLVIHRYNADGTVDTSFGTAGQTIIPFTGTNPSIQTAPHNLLITSTGQILLAAEAYSVPSSTSSAVSEDVVARLTSSGQLDSTFGTDGEFVLPSTFTGSNSVIAESSGRIVVAAVNTTTVTADVTSSVASLVGLTSAGALDSTFGTGGVVAVPNAQVGTETYYNRLTLEVTGLHLTPSGQLFLGVTTLSKLGVGGIEPPSHASTLTRFGADGTIDTTFGTAGTLPTIAANDFLVQTDGRVVLADTYEPTVTRLTPDGATDPTFQPPTPTSGGSSLFDAYSGFSAIVVGADGTITALNNNLLDTQAILTRFESNGAIVSTFGRGGQIPVSVPLSVLPSGTTQVESILQALALTAAGNILVGGGLTSYNVVNTNITETQGSVLAQIRPISLAQVANDYTGTGQSDLAAELTQFGAFAYRTTSGDTTQTFGIPGSGQTIPAPGDYDGDGKTDLAAYLPTLGILAYRPSSGGADVYLRFGPTGTGGNTPIPAPGDYDGDGKTDFALYLPSSGTLIVDPSGGALPYAVVFGPAGAGNAIPAPGDYDGDGKTDLALYLPTSGAFAIDPSGGATPYAVPFGMLGAGNTIPAPGDYDGDGKTDLAAFLPTLGIYADRASSGTGDVLTRFGPTGAGAAIPVPGDYDGDGKTDVALFLPGSATYAIDPSGGGTPYAAQFGAAGAGNTVPATAVVMDQGTVSAMSLADNGTPDDASGLVFYLPDDVLGTATHKRPTT